jgi:hypothetical protein
MKKLIFIVLVVIVVGMGGALALNHFQLQSPMNSVLKSDPRNDGIDVSVHYGNFIDPSTVVYDLRNVSGSNSPADVFRVLLQYAERLKGRQFDNIELAYKGTVKFKIEGNYFQTLGEEYGTQNVVYTVRTFPEHLKTPTGAQAYSEWTGGWLGVMNKQMEDFGDFNKHWYLSDQ